MYEAVNASSIDMSISCTFYQIVGRLLRNASVQSCAFAAHV